MKSFSSSVWCLLVLVSGSVADGARAQCPDWKPGFHVNGTNNQVLAVTQFDDGSGPKLVVGGRYITSAGNVAVRNIAAWDGSSWSALGSGIDAPTAAGVFAFATFDDGTGPALYAAGYFSQAGGASASSIAKWNGSTWSPLGSGVVGTVAELAVFDDGTGPALYAAGLFETAGGVSANNIAKWDGSTWSTLGSGLQGDEYTSVGALAVFDDGSGAALYAGGSFQTAGGVAADNIAKWNGSTWSPVGGGTDSTVRAFTVFDDGSGSALYAVGGFSTAGGTPAPGGARWDGSSWSAFGAPVYGFINQLLVFNDGSGPAIHAAGNFTGVSLGAQRVAKWNGSDWAPLGSGTSGEADAIALYNDGSGTRLVAGGQFGFAGGLPANNVAVWNGASWSAIGDGSGLNNGPLAMLPFDDGSGPALFAGGYMSAAGGTMTTAIAKWDGSSWSALGGGMSVPTATPASVRALALFDDGSGTALYAGGYFATAGGLPVQNIAKWDGSAWSALGSGIGGTTYERVDALATYDDGSGPALYAAGAFTAAGGASANHIARWNGSAWTTLGSGIEGLASYTYVYALAVYDDGSGPALCVAGSFTTAGGTPAANVAKWNGTTWSALGSGTNHIVSALGVADVGSGPALYAGGYFSGAGGTPAERVARWDGSTWSALGAGFSGMYAQVTAFAAFDDGSGPALYAGGRFTSSGSLAVENIAKWNGTAWSALGSGLTYPSPSQPMITSLVAFDDASNRNLYAGGTFTKSGSSYANFIAAWSTCPGIGTGAPFCFGDGTGAACPCANHGLPGHGCKNSVTTRGAELTATGQASLGLDALVLRSGFEPDTATSIFLQGTLEIAPVFFGDGLRCTGGVLKRLYVKGAAGGIVTAPTGSDLPASVRSAVLGDAILAGETRVYQVYYRDPSPTFCPVPTGNTFNVSQALRILWTP